MFAATIQEPEEETNRFRKYIWALTYSAKLGQPSLAALKQIEKDPARLLATLFGALQSRNIETLRLVGRMADDHINAPSSELARHAFTQISNDAKRMIESFASANK